MTRLGAVVAVGFLLLSNVLANGGPRGSSGARARGSLAASSRGNSTPRVTKSTTGRTGSGSPSVSHLGSSSTSRLVRPSSSTSHTYGGTRTALPTSLSPTRSARTFTTSTVTSCASCARDDRGRIARSSSAKREFEKETRYPNGRPGWVIDHVVPLKRGGADAPSNMQWQTVAAAKSKDRVE